MRARRWLTPLLLGFVVFTAGYAVGKEVGSRQVADLGGAADTVPGTRLEVVYFHSTKRCKTCNTMEAYAKAALDDLFADDLASGSIVWRTANMDEAWNREAVERYGLIRSSLVLADRVDGAERDWTVLDRTWQLTDDEKLFAAYVESEIEMILDGRLDEYEDDDDEDDDDEEE